MCFVNVVHPPPFKEHKRTNKHDDHLHSTKQSRRRHRHKLDRQSASPNHDSLSYPDNVVSKPSTQHYQEHEIPSNECVVSPSKSIKTKTPVHNYSDSDGESERVPVKPWSPTPHNGSSPLQFANNNNTNDPDSPTLLSPQSTHALRILFEMITEDLDKFVYTPAPNGLGDIQCRITRDKRGMEKGLFPTYYMHVERPGDGKKVRRNKINNHINVFLSLI